MKKKVKTWKDELKTPAKFKAFYNFVFDYLKEERTILTIEEATAVWDIIGITEARWPMLPKWLEFIQVGKLNDCSNFCID